MPASNKDKIKILSSNTFPVVGIGASAGGLEAFKSFIKAIPNKSGMAYILVQHLDPSHESILPELLQKVTTIPIAQITNNIRVQPDHIYIIPANKLLTATDGVLQLSARLPKKERNMPIDLFFQSLAEVHKSHAIGVVLSGTATDGTLGLKAIKEQGGITIAQDQKSAAYPGMPQNAIDSGVVDFILSPENIPTQLLALQHPVEKKVENEHTKSSQIEDDTFRQVLSLLIDQKGVDFTFYKQTTIRRRINRRIAMTGKGGVSDYVDYLKENTAELNILYEDLLIPVTEFFRDRKVFESLTEKVFPALLEKKPDGMPIRIWIAGCSSGEEVYSMAICLQEYLDDKGSNNKIQLFGTDISEMAISKARSGSYKKSELVGVSELQLERFFTFTEDKFRVNKSIRDYCVFARHNYLKDPPFAKIDLISCRNSLIYLEPVLQKNALTTFHYALNENGFLLLGKSETSGVAADLFKIFDTTSKIYTRKQVKGRFLPALTERKEEIVTKGISGTGKVESGKDDFQKNADDVLLSGYVPAGVIVNNDMEIVQFRGSTGRWLEPPPGNPNMNLLKWAREGLVFELRNLIHKAKQSKEALVKEDISMLFMGKEYLVTLEVIPLLNTHERHYLVLFKETSIPIEISIAQKNGKGKRNASSNVSREQALIAKLQKEISTLRGDMKNITEDQEASNEELQSANEELLSGSEEMQTLNEELETSKEEIQTSNEELLIVNQELLDRNEQLNHARLYAESVITTIRSPMIILNKSLMVKSANRSYCNKFQTMEEDIKGKLLFELGNRQWDKPEFREILEKMLPDKVSIDDFEITYNIPTVGERILMLNATTIVRENNAEESILLAIEDITEERVKDKAQKLFAEQLEKQVIERTASLNESNLLLQDSNKNLEQFAHIASHDLQEPLRKIRTFSSILQKKFKNDLPEEGKELIGKLSSSADRMSTLITEVLNLSKILHGEWDFEMVDLSDSICQVLDDFELLITEKSAVINYEDLPVIEAVPLQVSQLFFNLISNSLKFSKRETAPVINISSRIITPKELKEHKSLDPQLSYCEIVFTDNGIGFDQRYSEKIFLMFHRLHGDKHFSGTGIGLALCKSIVNNLHGEILAFSNDKDGATFKIILPLTQKKK